jgi:E3 ubiquitin-protein ligase RFWD2
MKFQYYARSSQFGDNPRVSQIQFDKEENFFAVGGYLNEIQVFSNEFAHGSDHDDNTLSTLPQPAPLQCMVGSSYITDLAWSNHSRGQISCTDFSGDLTLWDAMSASRLVQFSEHTAQAWSVDYSHTEPGVLASASEDKTVRLWDVSQQKSVGTIPTLAEVCCVRFNPVNEYQIVFGGANYMVSPSTRIMDQRMNSILDKTRIGTNNRSFESLFRLIVMIHEKQISLWWY